MHIFDYLWQSYGLRHVHCTQKHKFSRRIALKRLSSRSWSILTYVLLSRANSDTDTKTNNCVCWTRFERDHFYKIAWLRWPATLHYTDNIQWEHIVRLFVCRSSIYDEYFISSGLQQVLKTTWHLLWWPHCVWLTPLFPVWKNDYYDVLFPWHCNSFVDWTMAVNDQLHCSAHTVKTERVSLWDGRSEFILLIHYRTSTMQPFHKNILNILPKSTTRWK